MSNLARVLASMSPCPVPRSAMNVDISDPKCSTVVRYSGTMCWTRKPLYPDSDHVQIASGERTMLIPDISIPTRYSASPTGAPALIQRSIFTGLLSVSKALDMSHDERYKGTHPVKHMSKKLHTSNV